MEIAVVGNLAVPCAPEPPPPPCGFEIELDHSRRQRRGREGRMKLLSSVLFLSVMAGLMLLDVLSQGSEPGTRVLDATSTADISGQGGMTPLPPVDPLVFGPVFGLPAEAMVGTMAALLPPGEVRAISSRSYTNERSGGASRPGVGARHAVQMGSVLYDDGAGKSLVRVVVRQTPSEPNVVYSKPPRRAHGVLTSSVTAVDPDGLTVTVTQWAAVSPRGPSTRASLPLAGNQLRTIATHEAWLR